MSENNIPVRYESRHAVDHYRNQRLLELFGHTDKTDLVCLRETRLCPAGFSPIEWVKRNKPIHFIFADNEDGILEFPWGWVEFHSTHKNLELFVFSNNLTDAENWIASQDAFGFLPKSASIKWMHGPNWPNVSIQDICIQSKPAITSAYPWLGRSVEDYAAEYMDSSASILILIGPPGTGKTSFLRQMVTSMDLKAGVTYEEGLLRSDGLFAYFIGNDEIDALIFEDADTYLGTRKDGNDLMHRFLNVSNGLISPLIGKKLIFSTNLPSIAEIDPALTRPGRCYEVLHFRPLTASEAQVTADEVYGKGNMKLENKSYTLAEITNLAHIPKPKANRGFGFLP